MKNKIKQEAKTDLEKMVTGWDIAASGHDKTFRIYFSNGKVVQIEEALKHMPKKRKAKSK